MVDSKNGTDTPESGGSSEPVGSREKYERILAEREAGVAGGSGQGDTAKGASGSICPRLRPGPEGKGCRSFVKGGTCKLIEAFLCVEYMRKRGFDDARIRDACAQLIRVPVEVASVASGAAPGRISPREASEAEQKRIVALMKATEADIASLEGIDFRAVLDVPHLGGVEIVNRYRPTGTRQLSIRHALLLAAVTACFPGATVSQLEIRAQPKTPDERDQS